MIVKVTKRHIEKGRARDCAACPVALALHALGYRNAVVAPDYWARSIGDATEVEDVHIWKRIPLPEKVTEFIHQFDRDPEDARLKPFTFRTRSPRPEAQGKCDGRGK